MCFRIPRCCLGLHRKHAPAVLGPVPEDTLDPVPDPLHLLRVLHHADGHLPPEPGLPAGQPPDKQHKSSTVIREDTRCETS